MTGHKNILTKKLRMSIVLLAAMGFAACDDNKNFGLPAPTATDGATAAVSGGSQTTQLVERDVEAPDVFQVTGAGLWDGRPSLGGVWVAHPTVDDPERVIIRNKANGKFVIGALFRRERENPGPSLQVSSDAAEALGLLAGAPATLNVTALRREKAAASKAPDATTDLGEPDEIPATQLDPIDGAAAAIDAAEASTTPTPVVATPIAAHDTAPAPKPAPAASNVAKPFIQIGIFSIEANATGTADKLRGDGMSAKVIAQESEGRNFWRVIVGPTPNEADRAAILLKVKALGFTDAYYVTD